MTVSARELSRTGFPRRARRPAASDRREGVPSFGPPSAPALGGEACCLCYRYPPSSGNTVARSIPALDHLRGGAACPRPSRRHCSPAPARPSRGSLPLELNGRAPLSTTRGRGAGSALGFDVPIDDRSRGWPPSLPVVPDLSRHPHASHPSGDSKERRGRRASPRRRPPRAAHPPPPRGPCGPGRGAWPRRGRAPEAPAGRRP